MHPSSDSAGIIRSYRSKPNTGHSSQSKSNRKATGKQNKNTNKKRKHKVINIHPIGVVNWSVSQNRSRSVSISFLQQSSPTPSQASTTSSQRSHRSAKWSQWMSMLCNWFRLDRRSMQQLTDVAFWWGKQPFNRSSKQHYFGQIFCQTRR